MVHYDDMYSGPHKLTTGPTSLFRRQLIRQIR